MKRLILHSLLFAMLSIFAVSCSKEEVKPFSTGDISSNNFTQRDGDDTDGDGILDVDDDDADGDGITDGGSSSDYDSKGTKKKKN